MGVAKTCYSNFATLIIVLGFENSRASSYLSGQASPIFLTASSSFGIPVEYPGGGIENCVPLKPLLLLCRYGH